MPKPTYPTITDATLIPFRAIEVQLENAPDLLDRPECPYPSPIKAMLKRLLGKTEVVQRQFDEDDLLREITDLYDELRNTTVSGHAKDTIALIKTRADLLSRLVDLKGKQMNQRDMARFQRTIIAELEAQMTPAQRNEFMERLGTHVR